MRIVILYNPVSGAGRAAEAAEQVATRLREHGHSASLLATQLTASAQWLDPALRGEVAASDGAPEPPADLLVVAGGDGAMRLAAPAACRNNTAIYHLPSGTENLFAREFGMDAAPGTVLAAIERQQFRTVDVGLANGHCFLLMASVGFDAEVVHELSRTRGASISHSTYIKPVFATMRAWSPPTLEVEVEGESLVRGQPGMVVIANSRQYGWRIDPAGRADMSDGLLDIVFFPARSLMHVVKWVIRCRLRRQFRHRDIRFARGRSVQVRSDQPQRFQLDGDPPGAARESLMTGSEEEVAMSMSDQASDRLLVQASVCPRLLRVLTAR